MATALISDPVDASAGSSVIAAAIDPLIPTGAGGTAIKVESFVIGSKVRFYVTYT